MEELRKKDKFPNGICKNDNQKLCYRPDICKVKDCQREFENISNPDLNIPIKEVCYCGRTDICKYDGKSHPVCYWVCGRTITTCCKNGK